MIPDAARQAAANIDASFAGKARAELRAADALLPGADAVPWSGSHVAALAFVKGLPGPAEASGGAAMSGADGAAALKAAEKLGYRAEEVFFTVSRPQPGSDASARAQRLRRQLDAVGADVVLATDAEGAQDVAAAFDSGALPFGREVRVLGRRLIAIDGLEASLRDTNRKRRVWAQMLAARREGPVY